MARINDNYLKLKAGYLFPEIGRRVAKLSTAETPAAKIIRLGIGDVTRPLAPAVLKAFHAGHRRPGHQRAVPRLRPRAGLRLAHRQAIIEKSYKPLGVELKTSEMFISDGSKCDCSNILDIFALDNKVAIGDPVYPVYNDTNVMVGRTGEADEKGYYQGIVYLPCTEENDFVPALPKEKVDIIYLCSPNNPTGTVATQGAAEELGRLRQLPMTPSSSTTPPTRPSSPTPGIPHSIYEIEGAKKCAIEFRSFSKTAGFTGVRCALTVVPEELTGNTAKGETVRPQQALEPPPEHQVQRRLLPGAARRRRGLLRRGLAAGQGDHRLLHGQRADHPRGPARPPASPATAGSTPPTSG